jgi:hypothetical protein
MANELSSESVARDSFGAAERRVRVRGQNSTTGPTFREARLSLRVRVCRNSRRWFDFRPGTIRRYLERLQYNRFSANRSLIAPNVADRAEFSNTRAKTRSSKVQTINRDASVPRLAEGQSTNKMMNWFIYICVEASRYH